MQEMRDKEAGLLCMMCCLFMGCVVGFVMPIMHWTGNYEFGTTQSCYCPEVTAFPCLPVTLACAGQQRLQPEA